MTAHAIEARPVYTTATPEPTDLLLAGFLAHYTGHTAAAVRTDLKHYLGWLLSLGMPLLAVERPHLELYLRHLETWISTRTHRPLRPATIARMFGTVKLLHTYAHEEDYTRKNPGSRIDRPPIPEDVIGRTFLTPLEYAGVLREARKDPRHHALVALLGMLGLRISEACGLDIDKNLSIRDGYEVIHFIGKGAKPAVIPLPPPAARALHEVIAGRFEGPILLNRDGRRMDRACAARLLRQIADAAGVTKPITPHGLRRTAITSGLIAGVPLRDMQVFARHADPKMTVRYDMLANQLDRHPSHRVAGFLASMAG